MALRLEKTARKGAGSQALGRTSYLGQGESMSVRTDTKLLGKKLGATTPEAEPQGTSSPHQAKKRKDRERRE
eukprot:2516429-Amphidinium_carterae.1